MEDNDDKGTADGFGGFILGCPLTIKNLPFFILYVFQHKGLDY
jgi:hypothetical protein